MNETYTFTDNKAWEHAKEFFDIKDDEILDVAEKDNKLCVTVTPEAKQKIKIEDTTFIDFLEELASDMGLDSIDEIKVNNYKKTASFFLIERFKDCISMRMYLNALHKRERVYNIQIKSQCYCESNNDIIITILVTYNITDILNQHIDNAMKKFKELGFVM